MIEFPRNGKFCMLTHISSRCFKNKLMTEISQTHQSFESFSVIMDGMDILNADKEIMAGLLSKFEVSPPSFDCLEEVQGFTKLKNLFFDIIERLKSTRENVSPTSSVF
ncbi:hypothetical protein AVEN_49316-1 [Araneus ventricosus]|uniref:Uncharacterized protein n=1 Tax=Araneus ventricosus TaxID=182803 RepID=A0A4Y2RMN2_ARAVE|nr:hypothetical protein AVEN_49316-1 [Araneus ventricosus]